MAKRIKVLQLQSKYAAGVNHVADMISSCLSEDQYDVTMAYLEGEPEVILANTKLFYFSKNQCRGLRREVNAKLLMYCREQQFDIVIGHRFKAISALMPVVRKLNISKAIAVIHGIGDYDRWYRKLLASYYFARHWQVVAVSNYVKDYLVSAAKVFRGDLVTVIPNAVDIGALSDGFLPRLQARAELGLTEDDFVFGAHGRLAKVKGYDYLLKAFALVAKEHCQAKLLLIGDGPLLDGLQRSASALKVSEQVILTGYRKNANRYLSALDVFVMPSHSEGLSIALLEAMAAGLPLIATNIASIKNVAAGVSDLLAVGDLAAWEQSMGDYITKDTIVMAAEGDLCFQRVGANFSYAIFSKRYLQLVNG